MTLKERRKPEIIKATRKRRIAAGAGVQVQEVNRLLKEFEQMQDMMKKMKGGGMMKMMKRMGGMKGMPKWSCGGELGSLLACTSRARDRMALCSANVLRRLEPPPPLCRCAERHCAHEPEATLVRAGRVPTRSSAAMGHGAAK